jgi:hypothetical protein
MKERPILFSAPMVRVLLDGSKTQTRRIVKGMALEWLRPDGFTPEFVASPENYLSPYGQPGDRLYVRETWQFYDWTEDGEPCIRFAADNATIWPSTPPGEALVDIWAALSRPENYSIDNRARDRRWRPSIFMPRWASRITSPACASSGCRTSARRMRLPKAAKAIALVMATILTHFATLSRLPNIRRYGNPSTALTVGTLIHGYGWWNSSE